MAKRGYFADDLLRQAEKNPDDSPALAVL